MIKDISAKIKGRDRLAIILIALPFFDALQTIKSEFLFYHRYRGCGCKVLINNVSVSHIWDVSSHSWDKNRGFRVNFN